jgi:hypothetical protein
VAVLECQKATRGAQQRQVPDLCMALGRTVLTFVTEESIMSYSRWVIEGPLDDRREDTHVRTRNRELG